MGEKPPTTLTTLDEYLKFRELFTEEQLLNVMRGMGRAKERAVTERCEQTLMITFNSRGLPRYLKISDDMELKP